MSDQYERVPADYCSHGQANADDADALIKALNGLLYETEGVRSLFFDARDRVISKAFSFIEQLGTDGKVIEHEIIIQHDTAKRPDSDFYNVSLEWRPLPYKDDDEAYTTIYTVDRSGSDIDANVLQPSFVVIGDLCGEVKHQTSMTPYDYRQLNEALAAFSARHERERAVAQEYATKAEREEFE